MSLTQRKTRQLTRDAGTFRDDRLFIVACDDQYAPRQYFDAFKLSRVQVHVVTTDDGTSSASFVLDRLLRFEHEPDDERWLLLDTDHYTQGSHIKSFMAAIRKARHNGVKIAISKPCFELWLLLHVAEESTVGSLADASETSTALRVALGEYNKTQLKAEHYPVASVVMACERAERLDTKIGGGEIPSGNTTRVYQLWRAIAAKALPSQLPPELRGLLP